MKIIIFALTLITATSAFAAPTTLNDLSRHQDSALIFDKSSYDSKRSGALYDSKNGITLAVRCYESDIESTFAVQVTDSKGTQVVLDIEESKCKTILKDVIRDGKISDSNPLFTAWARVRGNQSINDLRLSGIQMQDRHMQITSWAHDKSVNERLEQEADLRLQEFRSGQRGIYIPSSYTQIHIKGDSLYVKASDNQVRIRTEYATVDICNKKPADTIERFFKNLLGSKCYYF